MATKKWDDVKTTGKVTPERGKEIDAKVDRELTEDRLREEIRKVVDERWLED